MLYFHNDLVRIEKILAELLKYADINEFVSSPLTVLKRTYNGIEKKLGKTILGNLLDQFCNDERYEKRNYMSTNQSKALVKEIISEVQKEIKILKKKIYYRIIVDGQSYNLKSASWTPDYDQKLLYLIVTTQTRQELNALLANLQKGRRSIDIHHDGRRKYGYSSERNAYVSLQARCPDENLGDGYHAIIYMTGNNLIKVHKEENMIDKFFDWLNLNMKTGLLPEWADYFFIKLMDMELISEANGFDLTGKAPSILLLSEDITTELVRKLKQEGLRNKEISFPASKVVELDPNATFLELVQNYVLDNLQDEEAHYNIGEPISDIFKSEIRIGANKRSRLYPRQQVIAQGMLNAFKEGKTSQILNGGTGIGKTYISIKLMNAIVKEFYKKDNARIIVYAQGHLIPKWKRQCNEALNPLGIYPTFYEIKSYLDILNIPAKPNGYEIFLMPKDRVKRSYQVKFASESKYKKSLLKEISNFIDSNTKIIHGEKEIVFLEAKGLPVTALKLTANRIAREVSKPVILYYANRDGKTGEFLGVKIVTTSKILKKKYGISHKSYDFIVNNLSSFIHDNEGLIESLIREEKRTFRSKPTILNGMVCPECGGYLYRNPADAFDEERYLEFIAKSPNNKSSANNKCKHFIKANGVSLTPFELKGIREGFIRYSYTSQKVLNPYQDLEGDFLPEDVVTEIKAGEYEEAFQILITSCNTSLWSAFEQKGYRVVNSADMMLRRFGKKHFDLAVCDEVHLYAKESEQGITFGKICQLSKGVFGLSGTITGGKSSDLYYTFWRMFPAKMVALGYDYSDVGTFVEHYGRRKKTTKETIQDSQYNKSGKGRKYSSGYSEIPGMSPLLYSNFLSGVMVSRKIEDMGIPMPTIRYFKHPQVMDNDLARGYEKLQEDLLAFMRNNKDCPLGGSYLNSLLSYPDMPVQEPIYYGDMKMLVANPTKIDVTERLFSKEKKLLETLEKEIASGRKVLIYSVFSGLKGVSERLLNVINKAGFWVEELKSTVPLEKREDWIERMDKKGVQVIVTNPECVATGLDIYGFPSLYFYEQSYNIKTMRQAEKRAYRPGQEQECRVFYSYYEDTLQEEAIKLIGSKKKASLALEGVFAEDMLSAMGDGGDDGSKILFNVLKGKVKLAEEELDVFGFEDFDLVDVDLSPLENIETEIEISPLNVVQQSLFTITEEDFLKMSKFDQRKASINQLSLFSF